MSEEKLYKLLLQHQKNKTTVKAKLKTDQCYFGWAPDMTNYLILTEFYVRGLDKRDYSVYLTPKFGDSYCYKISDLEFPSLLIEKKNHFPDWW